MDVSLTRGRKATVRPAGAKNYSADESASAALDFSGRPPTPERLTRFRMPSEPGRRVRPGGPMRDDPIDTDRFYGAVSHKGWSAAGAMDRSKTKLEELAESKAEAVYKSAKREVLGKGYEYQDLPAAARSGSFAFGRPSEKGGDSTKELVCPTDLSAAERAAEAVYKKSHGAFEPGEQRTRMVDWSKTRIDPAKTRFGAVAKRPEKNGVGKCLDPGKDEEQTQARVVNLHVEAHRQFANSQTGRSRPLGLAPYKRPPPEVFGIGSGKGDAWGTAECLRGDYTEEEQLPDPDLGRATRPGFRNAAKDPHRVFGIPSLRTDVEPRSFSLAEPQNFGQDAPLKDLVNPSRFMTRGIDHSDFSQPRAKEELRSLFDAIGYSHLSEDEFDSLYRRAAEHYDVTDVGVVSVHELKLAIAEWMDAVEEDGKPPSWFGVPASSSSSSSS